MPQIKVEDTRNLSGDGPDVMTGTGPYPDGHLAVFEGGNVVDGGAVPSGGTAINAYDIPVEILGLPVAGQTVRKFKTPRAFTLPAAFAGSVGDAGVVSTNSPVFTVFKNGVSIGTVTFSSAGHSPVFASSGALFAIGDILTVVNPATQDATLADVAFTLMGTLV